MSYRLPHLASVEDVDQWAGRYDARAEFPNIMRRLVKGTNDSVVALHMGGGASVDYEGYDGEVTVTTGTSFVPAGASVWEFGVGAAPKTKAESDYAKRTADSRGVEKADTTFVFATPRLWAGAAAWAKQKRAEGVWKDVIALDATDIHSALEDVPTAHVYFSELISIPANGVWTLGRWWERYVSGIDDRLTPEILLLGREAEAEELLQILDHEPRVHLHIAGATIEDVMGFVAAVLIRAGADGNVSHLERALVVFEPGAMLFLGRLENLLILIPFDESLVRTAELATDNAVILRVSSGSNARISLPKLPIADVKAQLVATGVEDGEAHKLALAAFRSVLLFRARLRGEPTPEADVVTRQLVSSRDLRRLWLLGAWSSDRTGDTDVARALIGATVDDRLLAPVTTNPDPIFTHVGSSWKVIAPDLHVEAIGANLSTEDLAGFELAVQAVLGAVDPTLDTSTAERWGAGVFGPGRLHSTDLRNGVATTLAAFGALGGDVQVGSGLTLRGWAALVIRAVLERANGDATGKLWLSLVDLLPLLAEAAPDIVLDALERELDHDGPLKERMFLENDEPFGSSSPHVHILWALETVAWSEDHLSPAVDILAKLAELDPGGKLGNRPARSLQSIFRPWMPQTAASVEQRIGALRAIVRTHP